MPFKKESEALEVVKGARKYDRGLPTKLSAVKVQESVALKILTETKKINPKKRLTFNELWRMWLMDRRTVRVIEYAALTNRRFLTKLLDKAYPTPQSTPFTGDNRPIQVAVAVNLGYQPQGRIEGIQDPMIQKGEWQK